MERFIRWHKLTIGKAQNLLRINDYETLWLSWLKGLIMGIILMSFLSGCYIYEGTTYTDPNYNTGYYQPNTLTYYQTHYVPSIDLYYWNDLPYWGYNSGWYYYYGYRHMYPWWYYYHYRPAYYYSINTHVYCHIGPRNYVIRPKNNKRMDNVKNRNYNVEVVNKTGVSVKNNSNAPTKFQNRPNTTNIINTKPNRTNINTNTKPNRTNININSNRNNNKTNINRSNRPNNKVNTNRTNTNRNNSNRSNKTNNRRPR
tara:strand:+ start:1016 stop:1783 length:768 start_codon:yes stop_codon:yes gene_type:complete